MDYFAPGLVSVPVVERKVLAGAALAAGLAVVAVGLAGVRAVLGAATGLQYYAMSQQLCYKQSNYIVTTAMLQAVPLHCHNSYVISSSTSCLQVSRHRCT